MTQAPFVQPLWSFWRGGGGMTGDSRRLRSPHGSCIQRGASPRSSQCSRGARPTRAEGATGRPAAVESRRTLQAARQGGRAGGTQEDRPTAGTAAASRIRRPAACSAAAGTAMAHTRSPAGLQVGTPPVITSRTARWSQDERHKATLSVRVERCYLSLFRRDGDSAR